jgi:hypothetical protein
MCLNSTTSSGAPGSRIGLWTHKTDLRHGLDRSDALDRPVGIWDVGRAIVESRLSKTRAPGLAAVWGSSGVACSLPQSPIASWRGWVSLNVRMFGQHANWHKRSCFSYHRNHRLLLELRMKFLAFVKWLGWSSIVNALGSAPHRIIQMCCHEALCGRLKDRRVHAN